MARRATARLVVAAMLLTCIRPGVTQTTKPEDDATNMCKEYFGTIEPPLVLCQQALSDMPQLNDSVCPLQCKGIFQDMPKKCATFVDQTLPGDYQGEKASDAANQMQTFDICQQLFCPTEICGITLDVLRSMALFQLPYNLDSLAASADASGSSSSGGSSVNTGAIVGGVVAGNAVIVILVGGFILFRRRRHESRLHAAQMKALSMTSGAGLGSGLGGGSGGVGAGTLEAAERGLTTGGGKQAVAHLWAQAAAPGMPGAQAWPPHYPSPPPSTSTGPPTSYMQQDELEMMRLDGSQPSRQLSVQSDPLLSWVSSQLQRQGSNVTASLPGAHADSGEGSTPTLAGSGAVSTPVAADSSAAVDPASRASLDMQRNSSGGADEAPAAGGEDTVAALQPSLGAAASRRRSSGWPALDGQRSSGLVDLKPWQLQFTDLKIQRPLGEGSFGKVFQATWNETLVAVKLLLSTDDAAAAARSGSTQSDGSFGFPSHALDALQKEAGLMASLRHPNIVLFLGVCASPPAVVTEYCSRGSLLDVLRAASSYQLSAQQLTWVRRLSMALDAAKGMLCLHARSPPILHRDLKSPNLLVDAAWRVKVCDFNLSKLLEDSARSSSASGMLNPRWLAPEVLMGQPATAASDVFSYGTVLWELLTWRLPWEGANLYQLVFMVSRGERLPVPAREDLPGPDQLTEADYDAYVGIIQRCWAQEPSERPTFADIIAELRGIISRMVAASSAPPAAA